MRRLYDNAAATPPRPSNRRGHTFLELVISVAIASIIFLAIASAILLGSHAIPDPSSPSLSATSSSAVVNQLAGELESALYVMERSATTISFTVADRNGDGMPERIGYSWSGVPGSPLTRQYNAGPVVSAADGVTYFGLTPTIVTVTETYPCKGVEDGTDSLLIDYNTGSGLANVNVASNAWAGQYLTPGSFPAGATAWRPTRIKFTAKISSVPAVTLVQMRPVDVNLKPTSTVLEQYSLTDTSLGTAYAWVEVPFSQIDRIAPTGAIGLVLQWQSGATSAVVQANSGAGQLGSTDSGTTWSYKNDKSLQCQLYAKLTRSDSSQYAISKYLAALGIALQTARTDNPTIQRTAQALNHPELLTGLWELKFDKAPTAVDVNGDGSADWGVRGGGSFDAASINQNVWHTSSVCLDTAPGSDFANLTVVDVRFRNTSIGGSGGCFSINAARSGSVCAPIQANIRLQPDGTQKLTVVRKTSDTTSENLIAIQGLSNQFVDLHLIIDPVAGSVGVTVNSVQYGTFGFNTFTSSDTRRSASVFASGSAAEFQYVRIRVLEATP
jgi:hypothetical protein